MKTIARVMMIRMRTLIVNKGKDDGVIKPGNEMMDAIREIIPLHNSPFSKSTNQFHSSHTIRSVDMACLTSAFILMTPQQR